MGIRDDLADQFGDDLLFADNFDDAIIGIASGHDAGRVVYDYDKMIEVFVRDNGCTYEDALEYLEYNTLGAYVGKQTPLYVIRNEE
jgi:hypothetical protein